MEEGVVGFGHGFALGESRFGGVGHCGGLGRGGRVVEVRGEDWFRGAYGSREWAMRFARWNGRARSMM